MLFNTFEYVCFLAATVAAYYALYDIRHRMVVFLVASYLFEDRARRVRAAWAWAFG